MTTTPSAVTRRRGWIGILVGIGLTALGPIAGILWTIFSLQGAFASVEGNQVPPEHKARTLADGISQSMNATLIGIAVGVIGLVTLIVSIVIVVRARDRTPGPTP